MKKITIIIVTWNNQKDLLETLSSLRGINQSDFTLETIVVDNASSDNSVFETKNQFPDVKIIQNQENLGFAQGNNIGIAAALENKSDYLLLLNNDTLVEKNFLQKLFQTAENDLSLGLISPKIYFARGYEFHRDRYAEKDRGKVIWYAGGKIDWNNIICSHRGVDEVDIGQYNKGEITDFATGCCVLIRKELVLKIGILDKKYFMYFEDVDYSVRAKKIDYRVFYESKSIIWHKNAASSGKPGSPLHNYYLTRNRLYFGMKYAGNRTKTALFKDAFHLFKRNLPGERKGIIDFFLNRYDGRNFYGNY